MTANARSSIHFRPRAVVARFLCTFLLLVAVRILPAAEPPSTTSLPGGVTAIELTIESEAMGRAMPTLILLPPSYEQKSAARYPVLYLLHCAGGDYRMWPQGTDLVRELASREMIVVCPEGTPHGWYIDDFHLAAMKEAAAAAPPATAPATGYFTHPAFLKHRTGAGHPERPERLAAIEAALKQKGLWDRLAHPVPAPASLETIGLVHDADYIATARRDIEAGRATLSTGDTRVSPESWEAALLAAGAVCDAVDAVLTGKLRNAFCAVRPPGHHASPARGMGFCVFNNVAIGARHALRARGLERVLVIDWDVHHGNGTQDAFWTDPAVLQFHTQEWGIYPGSGKEGERGAGAAEGRILNIEIERGSGIEVFAKLYAEQLAPAARAFKPQLILVSAGYDSHGDDPLGGLALRSEDFGRLTRIVLDLADELCQGRVVIALEGGYDLNALGASAAATIAELEARGRAAQRQAGPPSQPAVTTEQPKVKPQ